ncbi:MFS transporter [Kitasatospora sp. NPDC096147]|uniref:MFS transporter n=1 Tax=Kitasatospora sp. NPDC096147 TaxID=3364093 RepID=UPI00382D9A4A
MTSKAATSTPVARTGPAPGRADDLDGLDPKRWKALWVCLLVGFMSFLDVSIVNVALPSIQTGLHTSEAGLSWVLSGYVLAFGLTLVPAGRLGDTYGRRTFFLAGLALFTAASVLCGLAGSEGWLIAARLGQGVAAGLLTPQISGLIQQLFRGAERGKAFGLLGSTIGIATAVGPVLGGLLIEALGTEHGWRWVFFVNLPIGLLAYPLARRLLPAGERRARTGLDPVGVLLLGGAVLALLLPLIEQQSWQGAAKWLLLGVGAVLLAGFLGWEHRYRRTGRAPLVDLGVFRFGSYSLGALLGAVYFAGFTSIFFIFTLYLQNGLGYSALAAGLAITPFAIGTAASSVLAGRNVHRFGRRMITIGLVLVVLGLTGTWLAVSLASGPSAGWATALPLLVAGLGSGAVISPNSTLTLQDVPVAQAGTASGMLQTGQRVSSAAGIAIVSSVFFARIGDGWDAAFEAGILTSAAIVGLALVIALADLLRPGRR